MVGNLIRAGILVILALALGFAVTQIDGEHGCVAMYSMKGEKFSAVKVYSFPLAVETSGLTYDDSLDVFYATPDKGRPHIVRFRLGKKSISILGTDTIVGLKRNYDFEGIELINFPFETPYLLISTERYRRKDSLVQVAVSLPGLEYLDSLCFAAQPEGMEENNNFEGITYDKFQDIILLAKEYGPYGMYVKRRGQPVELLFLESDFASVYKNFVDSALGPNVAADRIAVLQQVSFSGMAFDRENRRVLVLNRQGRAVIELEVYPDSRPQWRIVGVFPYQGIDDADVEGLEPAMLAYGIAEGLAVWGKGDEKRLAIITDPGTGGQPTLYVLRYPH